MIITGIEYACNSTLDCLRAGMQLSRSWTMFVDNDGTAGIEIRCAVCSEVWPVHFVITEKR